MSLGASYGHLISAWQFKVLADGLVWVQFLILAES